MLDKPCQRCVIIPVFWFKPDIYPNNTLLEPQSSVFIKKPKRLKNQSTGANATTKIYKEPLFKQQRNQTQQNAH